MGPLRGRPPGKGATVFWTEAERNILREAMIELALKLPHRTTRSVIEMMKRIDDGEFE